MFPARLENLVEQKRLGLQIEWNRQREHALRHLRHVKKIEEVYAEGLFVEEDDFIYTIREDYDYGFLEDDYEYELEHKVDCSTGGLFGQPKKRITENFADRVAELIYSPRWRGERSWLVEFAPKYPNTVLRILSSMGFDIPEELKNMKEEFYGDKKYRQGRWINDLGEHFEEFLEKEHPELLGFWKFTTAVYLLAD